MKLGRPKTRRDISTVSGKKSNNFATTCSTDKGVLRIFA